MSIPDAPLGEHNLGDLSVAGERPGLHAPAANREVAGGSSDKAALRHRVLLNFEAEAGGVTPDQVIDQIINAVAFRK